MAAKSNKNPDPVKEISSAFNTLKPSTAAALAYAPFVGFFISLFLYFTEKRRFVKWHAAQSLSLSVVAFVLSMLALFMGGLVSFTFFIISLYALYQVYQGVDLRLPLLSDIADKFVK